MVRLSVSAHNPLLTSDLRCAQPPYTPPGGQTDTLPTIGPDSGDTSRGSRPLKPAAAVSAPPTQHCCRIRR